MYSVSQVWRFFWSNVCQGRSPINAAIFPAPAPTYTAAQFGPALHYAPLDPRSDAARHWPRGVPLLLLRPDRVCTQRRLLVLFAPGNGTDLGIAEPYMRQYVESTGLPFLVMEKPGYGLAQGVERSSSTAETCSSASPRPVWPSEEACHAFADAAFAYAVHRLHYEPEQVVLAGHSLGTGIVAALAARLSTSLSTRMQRAPAALVLVAPFRSMQRMAQRIGGTVATALVSASFFDTETALREVRCPLMIAHGDRDDVIPFQDAMYLYERCSDAARRKYLLVVSGAKHEPLDAAMLGPELRRFLQLPRCGRISQCDPDEDEERRGRADENK